MSDEQHIVIYESEDGQSHLDVRLEEETVWLTQAQIAMLFETTPQNITMHLNNVFDEGELDENSTCKDFLQVREEGKRKVRRNQKHYNLDGIISVGYRVKSARATQFRKWATNVLRDHLVKGYTINQRRLEAKEEQVKELKETVKVMSRAIGLKKLTSGEAEGILQVLEQYAYALDTLDRYDHQSLKELQKEDEGYWKLTYEEAKKQIDIWREKQNAGTLFGNEKDDSLSGSLDSIYQSFDGKDLYPSIEEKAAHLLYFLVKNHSFTDGNKRIAAGLFAYFLDQNQHLYRGDGTKIIEDNALVAITIMIAESDPKEKETMVTLIVNLIIDYQE